MQNTDIDVRLSHEGITPIIDVVQGDSGRNLTIYTGDISLAGKTARVYIQKPSGLEVYNNAVISGNAVTVQLTRQMLAEAGNAKMQVSIYDGAKRATTFDMFLDIKPSLQDNGGIESSNEYAAIDAAIAKAEAAAGKINTLKYAASTTVGGSATSADKVKGALSIIVDKKITTVYDGSSAKTVTINAGTCVSADMGKYVDPKSGNDANDGAIDTPYKTIAKALAYFPKNLGGRSVRIILNSSGYTEFNDGITVSGFYNGTLTFEKRSPNNADTDRAIIRGNIKLSNNDARVILKEIEVAGDNTTNAITVSNTSMVGVKSCKVSGAASYAGIYTTRNGRLSVSDTMIHSCDIGVYMYNATGHSAETAVNMLSVSNVTTHTSAGYKNRLGYSLNGCIMFAAHNKADLPELGVTNFRYNGLTVIYNDSAI